MKEKTKTLVRIFFHPLYFSRFTNYPLEDNCCFKCCVPASKIIGILFTSLFLILMLAILASLMTYGASFEEPTQLFFYFRTTSPNLTAAQFYAGYIIVFLLAIYCLVYLSFEKHFIVMIRKGKTFKNPTQRVGYPKDFNNSIDLEGENLIKKEIENVIEFEEGAEQTPSVSDNNENEVITIKKSEKKTLKKKCDYMFNYLPHPIYMYLCYVLAILILIYALEVNYISDYILKYSKNGPYGPVVSPFANDETIDEILTNEELITNSGRNIYWHTHTKTITALCISDKIEDENILKYSNFIPKFTKIIFSTGNIIDTKIYNIPISYENTTCNDLNEIKDIYLFYTKIDDELDKLNDYINSYHHAISIPFTKDNGFSEEFTYYYRIPNSYVDLNESDRGKFYIGYPNENENVIENYFWSKFYDSKENFLYFLHGLNSVKNNNQILLISDIHVASKSGYLIKLRQRINELGNLRAVFIAGDVSNNGNSPIEFHLAMSDYVIGAALARSLTIITVGNHERQIDIPESNKNGRNLGMKQILQNNPELSERLFHGLHDVSSSKITKKQKEAGTYGTWDISSHQTMTFLVSKTLAFDVFNLDSFSYKQPINNRYEMDSTQINWLKSRFIASKKSTDKRFRLLFSHMLSHSMGPSGSSPKFVEQIQNILDESQTTLNLHFAGHDHLFSSYINSLINYGNTINDNFVSIIAASAGVPSNMVAPLEKNKWKGTVLNGPTIKMENQLKNVKDSYKGQYHAASKVGYSYTVITVNENDLVKISVYDVLTNELSFEYSWDFS